MAKKQKPENPTAIGDAASAEITEDPSGSLSEELTALHELNEHGLRLEWRRLYRREPPRLSRDLLMRGVAYRLQEMASSGLSKATLRKLASFAKQLETGGRLTPIADAPRLRSGTRLVREWRGRTHTVTIVDGGFDYRGDIYPSLSKIAAVITGAHWSGPRFFGISDRRASAPPSNFIEKADDGKGSSALSHEQESAHVNA